MTGPTRRPGGESARAPGRPRSPAVDSAILDATLALVAEEGFTGFSVEAVAARAGVGKATIYRRWPNKESLVLEALSRLNETAPPVLRGDLRGDLVALVDVVRRKSASSLAGRVLPGLLGAAATCPELMRLYRQRVILPRRAHMAEVLRRGVSGGELRADIDIERSIDLLVGPMFYRVLMRPVQGPVGRALSESIVDSVLAGLAPR